MSEHHIVPLKTYFAVFATLMFFTAITVAVAFVDLGPANNVVMLSIAVLKATLVVMFFMHAKYGTRLIPLVAASGFFFVLLMFIITMSDYMSRGWLGAGLPLEAGLLTQPAALRHANASLLDLLLELQTLDRVPRSGYFLRGISDCESVSEHTFHLAMLVWFLAGEEPGLDRGHAVELALMHDLAELRIGDLPRTATTYLPAEVKHAAERRAAADILAPADPRANALYEEYEEGSSSEALFVRACDKLQLMIKVTVYESWGHRGLAEFWGNPANFPKSEFASIERLFRSLQERATSRPAASASG